MALITAETIFDGYEFLPKNTVLEITAEGIIKDIFQANTMEGVQGYEGMLMPGMVNAHCHLELSHLKGLLPGGRGLIAFLLDVVTKREQISTAEIKLAIEAAEKEMIENGIVAVGDISNTMDTLTQKARGNMRYHTFVECYGLKEERAAEIVIEAKRKSDVFARYGSSSVVLHAPYSVSGALIREVDALAVGKITSIHNQECEAENELFVSGSGDFLKLFEKLHFEKEHFKIENKTSIQTYMPQCVMQQRMILVHNTMSSEEDVVWANGQGKDLFWCLCPKANQYIENRMPDVAMLMQNTCKLVIGTDSLASNDTLSVWEEIKTLQRYLPQIPLKKMLKWATSNGAEALGLDAVLGSFAIGKKPGVVQIENFVMEQRILPAESKVRMLAFH